MEAENSKSRPVITATDHSAFIFIATALCLVCTTLFLSARLVVRWPWSRSFGPDDWTTLSASVGRKFQRECDRTDFLDMRVVPEYSHTLEYKSGPWRGRVGAFILRIEDSAQSMDPTRTCRSPGLTTCSFFMWVIFSTYQLYLLRNSPSASSS